MSSTKRTLATIKIEWNYDMDRQPPISLSVIRQGDYDGATFRGRCKSCWGRLIGRMHNKHGMTGIKCSVCRTILNGEDAQKEYMRMDKEAVFNLLNMGLGHPPKYGDGLFVKKVFPNIGRMTTREIKQKVRTKALMAKKEYFLTRSGFPAGSPGYLVLQARLLMAGLEDVANPDEHSVIEFPEFNMKADGSATVQVSTIGLSGDPQYSEQSVKRKIGTTMTESMMSAFSCELALKAICLTCKDEAPKKHDLVELYEFLPPNSIKRIEVDFPHIRSVLEDGRHRFGKWRYFETSINKEAMLSMIHSDLARGLSKAARVLLDECEFVGLSGSVSVNATQSVTVEGKKEHYHYKFDMNVKGTENPPRNDNE